MIIEPDRFYFVEGVYTWSPERSVAAWEHCYRELAAALGTGAFRKVILPVGIPGCGKSTYALSQDAADVVIVDGMFVYRDRRTRVLEIARGAGVPVEAHLLESDWDTCVARNRQRPADRRVPEESMRRMHELLTQDPPTLAEGFAAVIEARAAGS